MQQHSDNRTNPVYIALVGEANPAAVAHRAIPLALGRAARAIGRVVTPAWVDTRSLAIAGVKSLERCSGIWCVPGSPYTDTDAALAAIRFARETDRAFLGTCGGFQHAVIEYARNVLGWVDADHAEINPSVPSPLIAPLSCSLVEKAETIQFRDGTKLRTIYGKKSAEEQYHCNYGVNPHYYSALLDSARGLRVSATGDSGEIRAIELEAHPFFLATLFQPERSALRDLDHPLITAFVRAAADRGRPNRDEPQLATECTINQAYPWGRSFDEYCQMFRLTADDLHRRILGCADGPASFNAVMNRRGHAVVSCDPLYRFDATQIRARIEATCAEMVERATRERHRFVWSVIRSPEMLGEVRMAAMNEFLLDYDAGRTAGRYVTGELPHLPFGDDAFDLALCSHFLFLYSNEVSADDHVRAVRELARVSREVRVFPLLDMMGNPSRHLPRVIEALGGHGLQVGIEPVAYEFQVGGNQMMRITRSAVRPHRRGAGGGPRHS